MHVGFILFDDCTQLDFTGPFQVLSRIPRAHLHLVARTLAPVRADCGLQLVPTITTDDCPPLDLLCVPGGFGVQQVLEEKLVKRGVSLKALSYGKVEEATKGRARRLVTLNVGISQEKGKEIGKHLKELGLKGVSHQIQGDSLRVQGKKKDDLQAAIAALKEHDFGIPLQFDNFRD